ncbi:hypothetical protein T439DRAFT_360117 [Meredithblackwellia eburnea MCA 4105]
MSCAVVHGPSSHVDVSVPHIDVNTDSPKDNNFLRPALVYFHGGGVISGSRAENAYFESWLKGLITAYLQKAIFLSADYTLLGSPSQTEFDIVEDVKDLWVWIDHKLNDILEGLGSSAKLQNGMIAVADGSGGALPAAYAVSTIFVSTCRRCTRHPKPLVLLSSYGMGGNSIHSHYLTRKTTPLHPTFLGRPIPILAARASFAPVLDVTPPARPTTRDAPSPRPRDRGMAWLHGDEDKVVFGQGKGGDHGFTATGKEDYKKELDESWEFVTRHLLG